MTGLAIITGASSGLGSAFAKALAQQGYNLLLIARRQEQLEAIAETLPTTVHILALDLTTDQATKTIIEYLKHHHLLPTLLINNAGFGVVKPALEVDNICYDKMIDLNIKALTDLSLSVASIMKTAGHGIILNIASIAAFCPCPYLSVYGATKAYVLAFSENLSLELSEYGIHVCAICPGPVKTEFWQRAGLSQTESFDYCMMEPEAVVECALSALQSKQIQTSPGLLNKVLYILVKMLPRCLSERLSTTLIKKIAEKPKNIQK